MKYILTLGLIFFPISILFSQACSPPQVNAYALMTSCTNGIQKDDAYLQISAATNATHYDFSMGNTYTEAVCFYSVTNLTHQLIYPTIRNILALRIANPLFDLEPSYLYNPY